MLLLSLRPACCYCLGHLWAGWSEQMNIYFLSHDIRRVLYLVISYDIILFNCSLQSPRTFKDFEISIIIISGISNQI